MKTKRLAEVPVGSTVQVQATITEVNGQGIATMSLVQPDTGDELGTLTLNMSTGQITGTMDDAMTADVVVVRGTYAINDVVQWPDGTYLVVRWLSADGSQFSAREDGGGPAYSTADVTKVGVVTLS